MGHVPKPSGEIKKHELEAILVIVNVATVWRHCERQRSNPVFCVANFIIMDCFGLCPRNDVQKK
ncbi:MAG: hypothetical protein LBH30_02515 [Prevotellaceae bacterium]|nr:hypothetical protein [Prevotellaceae bacterium]